ncbi:hypothetical protein B0H10DRAFT_2314618 [Mycena sp. CBHHK59/15]|nr:hypothetical protein B0H10DRAFT_2314618 [Mycena sp. CBHHK59/15]
MCTSFADYCTEPLDDVPVLGDGSDNFVPAEGDSSEEEDEASEDKELAKPKKVPKPKHADVTASHGTKDATRTPATSATTGTKHKAVDSKTSKPRKKSKNKVQKKSGLAMPKSGQSSGMEADDDESGVKFGGPSIDDDIDEKLERQEQDSKKKKRGLPTAPIIQIAPTPARPLTKKEQHNNAKKWALAHLPAELNLPEIVDRLSPKKSFLIELLDVTALKKDGPSQCKQFAEMIDRVELQNGCIVIYFTTDADGGAKKGRLLLGKIRPWLILPSCWAHQFQLILGDYFKVNDIAAGIAEEATALIAWINNHGKVRKLFDASQRVISMDRNAGKVIILAYLVANLTRWTTHFVAFMRLFILREALQLTVLQNRTAVIAAEVGAATSTEGARLKEDAEKMCALIQDASFWNGLETVLGDLEPICLGTNINQKDSTRLDQVLLTIAGIFLRFADHPEIGVRKSMLARLEKRWKDCDQLVFLLALILNPFEKLSCFGPNANLNELKCRGFLIALYCRMKGRPDNADTADEKAAKENALSQAFMQYLSGTGDFADFDAEDWEHTYVWDALKDSKHLAELAEFAIVILNIVANQAGSADTLCISTWYSGCRVRQGAISEGAG